MLADVINITPTTTTVDDIIKGRWTRSRGRGARSRAVIIISLTLNKKVSFQERKFGKKMAFLKILEQT